jgi:hypothetical protein
MIQPVLIVAQAPRGRGDQQAQSHTSRPQFSGQRFVSSPTMETTMMTEDE